MTTSTGIRPDQLPAVIRGYLDAHAAHDTDAALAAFTPSAVVVDDGSTHRGAEEIRRFLSRAGAQFTYTTTLVGSERTDETHWTVTNRLEGDFPGGVVDLRYRFVLDGDRIAELVIAP
ncbi:nuclear transport factor 2 family protein [Blastococcus sp. TF02A-26]|uniref:nuclear transport factor 2 family protein n=1 Tax=Blastococcus sp. TF02A-26 TaxID=2250577 RepID=UPI000DE99D86|nr:nuclear transport factor 2 family protein [Blastococcus sp. TF02A-26]RBY80788.1 nuclear transport factor 2 family protein [Blastococcus sp. TF02A-26]